MVGLEPPRRRAVLVVVGERPGHGQVERESDPARSPAFPERTHDRPVRQQHVVGRPEGARPVGCTGSLRPERVAEEGGHPRLVVRRPVLDQISETVEDELGVLGEAVDRVACCPAAVVLECLRQIPVIERHERRDPALTQTLDQASVEVEPALVGRSTAVGLNPRPGDREAVCAQAERGHQVEVLAPAVVVLAGRVAGVPVVHLAGRPGEPVPDRLTAAVDRGRALDLEGRGRRAPGEVLGEGHPFTAPFMIPPTICLPRTRKTTSRGRIEMNVPVRMSA